MFRQYTAELYLQMFSIACRRFAPTLFPPWENNRAADSRPYMAYATELPWQKFQGVVVEQIT